MVYISDKQKEEVAANTLVGVKAIISRNQSQLVYTLQEFHGSGLKSVIWRAIDDLGNIVALRVIPSEDYSGRSIMDEMTEAAKLDAEYFAPILFFGYLTLEGHELEHSYKAVILDWIDGVPINEYVKNNPLTVGEFVSIVEMLFNALSILRYKELCHDDLHPGNVLIEEKQNRLSNETTLKIKIIDTDTIKKIALRESLLDQLRNKIKVLEQADPKSKELEKMNMLLEWKRPDDHLRVVESLLICANSLVKNYHRFDFWERKFIDNLQIFFQRATDNDLGCRLDEPEKVVAELKALITSSKSKGNESKDLTTPFDYISAEMIRNDAEFAELFSKECPWLNDCISLQPLYLYGPRGCGKSSVLRWLSFKTFLSDQSRKISDLKEIGIYVSCSVELRSRFWLFDQTTIDKLQASIIRYFSLLLIEELFDTLLLMYSLDGPKYEFNFNTSNISTFSEWVLTRIDLKEHLPRLQGQSHFEYLRNLIRKNRWEVWANIQKNKEDRNLPDPALVSDICREIPLYFDFFKNRNITFLIDDYSNQRIPSYLQSKLNQTISFAKQGTPIFKVSSEYQGVNLEGIQEGREVVEVNIGEKYTSLQNSSGHSFLADIINIRLKKANYKSKIESILGTTSYDNDTMPMAIVNEKVNDRPFYYHGIDCIHWLCSGDIALALDLIRRIFDTNKVDKNFTKSVSPSAQHKIIQQFSHDEIRRIRYIVPFGSEMYNIICYLGYISRVFVLNKKSERKDKKGSPICVTHLDIRMQALQELEKSDNNLSNLYHLITSRAILFSLETSRSRLSGSTERLQMRRIYFPAFKAPIKRDVPLKIDDADNLKSLLSNPQTFAERQLKKSGIEEDQLRQACQEALVKPRVN